MKPSKITITGLQSFKTTTTIDFNNLDNLFIICGETGSGKSTILDAIILALYGEIPRNKDGESISKNKLYSNMNNDSTFMEVIFEFYIDKDLFTIKRSYEYKENRKEQFSTKNCLLIKNDNIIAESPKQLGEELKHYLGLDYDNFTRTTILVQNKFSNFIKLAKGEKRKALSDIFDLQMYGVDFSDKIKNKITLLNEEINSIKADIDDVLEETTIKQLNDIIPKYTNIINKDKKELDILTKELNELKDYEQNINDIIQLKNLLNNDKEKLSNMDDDIRSINNYEKYKNDIIYYNNLLTAQNNLEQQNKNKNTTEEEIKKLAKDIKKIHLEKESLDLKLKDKKSEKESLNFSYDQKEIIDSKINVCNTLINYDNLDKEISLIKQELKTLEINNTKYNKDELQSTYSDLKTKIINHNTALNSITGLKRELSEVQTKLQDNSNAKKAIQQINKQELLNTISKDLKENEECPVCGSIHHPKLHHLHNNMDTIDRSLELDLNNLESREQKILSSIQTNEKNIIDITQVEIEIQAIENNIKYISDNENKIISLNTKLDDKNILLLQLKKDIDDSKIDVHNLDIKALEQEKEQYTNNKDKFEQLNEKINNFEIEITTTEKNIAQLLNNKQIKNNDIKNIEELIKENNDIIDNIKKQIDVNYIKDIITTLITSEEYNTIKTKVDGLNDSIKDYTSKINLLENKTKDFKPTNDINFINDSINKLDILIEKNTINSIQFKNIYDTENEKFKRSKELLVDLKNLNKKFNNLNNIKNVFDASYFVEYLASAKLKNIIHIANQTLSTITNNQYQINLINNIEFEIQDNFAENKSRTTTTLSGGETFIVSLALALALSQEIQLRNKTKIDFFFLDEGFGSLDQVSLEKVITALETIQKENNIKIGVISHVDLLQERITSQLKVTKDKKTNSSNVELFTY